MKPLLVGAGASSAGATAGGATFTPCAGSTGNGPEGAGAAWRALTARRDHATRRDRRRRRKRRRPRQHGLELRPEHRVELLAVVHQLHRRAAVRVANEIGEHVVDQGVFLELNRRPVRSEEVLDRLGLAGRQPLRDLDPVRFRVERHRPVVAVAVGQLEDRMEANHDRHRLGAQVVEPACALRAHRPTRGRSW